MIKNLNDALTLSRGVNQSLNQITKNVSKIRCHLQKKINIIFVSAKVNDFHALSINLLVKHQKKIMSRQFELKRVADCMIDLYAASACLSRATAAKAENKDNWQMEIDLCKTFVHEACARVTNNIAEVKR